VTIGGGNSSASCFLHALTAASVSKQKKVVRKDERNAAKGERSEGVFERTIASLFFSDNRRLVNTNRASNRRRLPASVKQAGVKASDAGRHVP